MHTERKRFMSGSDTSSMQVRGTESDGMVPARIVREIASNKVPVEQRYYLFSSFVSESHNTTQPVNDGRVN